MQTCMTYGIIARTYEFLSLLRPTLWSLPDCDDNDQPGYIVGLEPGTLHM